MLQIKPIDFETGEILNITPNEVKALDNEALVEFTKESNENVQQSIKNLSSVGMFVKERQTRRFQL